MCATCGKEQCWVLITKRDTCAYQNQYSAAKQQNVANSFSIWGKTNQLVLLWRYSQKKKEMGV
jgi:endonuclease YncB( thermonuclease family)